MQINNDTIAAISTPLGEGGIAVIRISGRDALSAAEKCCKAQNKITHLESHTIQYGKLIDPETKDVIDEALFSVMKTPKTYTGEDTCEISVHGGVKIALNALDAVLKTGSVRIAEPGEFTKRAFLNGKMDLVQAESVSEIISAKTDTALRNAENILEGKLSSKIRYIKQKLVEMISLIELSFDFIEQDIEVAEKDTIKETAQKTAEKLQDLITTFNQGRFLHSGINVSIIGRTNVGKSSLLNYMVQKEKAIVTDIPGTTRDTVEEYLNIDGFLVKIIDTAGVRKTDDRVETIGIDRSIAALKNSDAVLFVIDNSCGLTQEDFFINDMLKCRNKIYVFNKTDLKAGIDDKLTLLGIERDNFVSVSAKDEIGLKKLNRKLISSIVGGNVLVNREDIMITSQRQYDKLKSALHKIENILENDFLFDQYELLAEDLKSAKSDIDEILGEKAGEDVLDHIFSKFCIGK